MCKYSISNFIWFEIWTQIICFIKTKSNVNTSKRNTKSSPIDLRWHSILEVILELSEFGRMWENYNVWLSFKQAGVCSVDSEMRLTLLIPAHSEMRLTLSLIPAAVISHNRLLTHFNLAFFLLFLFLGGKGHNHSVRWLSKLCFWVELQYHN